MHLFEHNGIAYSPDGKTDVAPEDVASHNAAQNALDVAHAASKPERLLGYYVFPGELQVKRGWMRAFEPRRYSEMGDGRMVRYDAHVTTWQGTQLGRITSAHVYTHNFGGRFVALTANINGTTYYGRASWDNGTCINLRKAKRQ